MPLNKDKLNELATVASEGFARVVKPAGPDFDASVVYVLSTASETTHTSPSTLTYGFGSVLTSLVAEATLRVATASSV